jgi:hypothetical protein
VAAASESLAIPLAKGSCRGAPQIRQRFSRDNAQLNELLYRRVDLEDVVAAHLLALERATSLGFALKRLQAGEDLRSALAVANGRVHPPICS